MCPDPRLTWFVVLSVVVAASDGPHASIHPCRHASVMKNIISHLTGGGREARVDQYLFIFLKSVT